MNDRPHGTETWVHVGEVPGVEPDEMERAAKTAVARRVLHLNRGIGKDHEVVIPDGDHEHNARHLARNILIGAVAVGSVAALLAYRQKARVKRKK